MSAETQAIIGDIRNALIKAHALDGTPNPYVALTDAQTALTQAQGDLATAQQAVTDRTAERDAARTTIMNMIAAAAGDKADDAARVAGQGVLDVAAAAGFPTP